MSSPSISILTQVYGQPKMLQMFLDELRSWPDEEAKHCELVLVDDCGTPPVLPSDVGDLGSMSVQVLRHSQDVPWAQPCCRNLAASQAKGEVLVMLDPDMTIPPDNAHAFVREALELAPGDVTRFVLLETSGKNRGKINTTSPNCWILHKADFLKVGGYNEVFAGHKGWSDVELLHVLTDTYRVRQNRDIVANFIRRNSGVPDADVSGLDRDVKTNHAIHNANRDVVRRQYGGSWCQWQASRTKLMRQIPWSRTL